MVIKNFKPTLSGTAQCRFAVNLNSNNNSEIKLATTLFLYSVNTFKHRFTLIDVLVIIGVRARGAGGAAAPPDSGNSVFFGQKLNFSGRSKQPKMKKMYLLNEKTEFIPSREIKCLKSGIFTNNYWVG